jgi:hypothetical protein
MSLLLNSSAWHKLEAATLSSTLNWRAWWAEESARTASDWMSIAKTVTAIMHRLAGSSSWCSS